MPNLHHTPVEDDTDPHGSGAQNEKGRNTPPRCSSKLSPKPVGAKALMNTPGSTALLRPSPNSLPIPPPLYKRTNKIFVNV